MQFDVPGRPFAWKVTKDRRGVIYKKSSSPLAVYQRSVANYYKTVAWVSTPTYTLQGPDGEITKGVKRERLFAAKGTPVKLTILAVFARPKAMKQKPDERLPKATAPDATNIQKAVEDALTGVAWADDRQVWSVACVTLYGKVGEPPFTRVQIEVTDET